MPLETRIGVKVAKKILSSNILHIVLCIQLAHRQDGNVSAGHESDGEPWKQRIRMELIRNCGHKVRRNCIIKTVDQNARVDSAEYHEPLPDQ